MGHLQCLLGLASNPFKRSLSSSRPEAPQTMAPKLIVSHCHLSLLGITYPWLLAEVDSSYPPITYTGQESTYPLVPASALAD